MIKKIRELIKSNSFEDNIIYLLIKINDSCGFFYSNSHLIFMECNSKLDNKNYETQKIKCSTNIYINHLKNAVGFNEGYYNIIELTEDINSIDAEHFVELCDCYSNTSEENLVDFFISLSMIFKEASKQKNLNLIGYMGELFFIKYIFENYKNDLTNSWHYNGEKSQFDFRYLGSNIEVKSTIKNDNKFRIKYDQIKDRKHTYIVTISLEVVQDGLSLDDLIHYFSITKPFCENLNFLINLNKEAKRVEDKERQKLKFNLLETNLFDCTSLEMFEGISNCITNITFDYDFNGIETIDWKHVTTNSVIK